MRSREKHLERCKRRALWYLSRGKIGHAVGSLLGNLREHPGTQIADLNLYLLGFDIIRDNDTERTARFINSFELHADDDTHVHRRQVH